MDIVFNFLLSQSILIPLAIMLFRIKKIPADWMPFLVLLILGVLAEIASFIIIHYCKMGNAPVIKTYSLAECCLIYYLFYLWKNNKDAGIVFMVLASISILAWIIEDIVFGGINTFSPFFRVGYAFVIVLLSINQINSMMVKQDGSLLKNPRFILCIGFIISFIYQIVYEASFYIGSDTSVFGSLPNKIIMGNSYINFSVNLLSAYAVLRINNRHQASYGPVN